MRRSKFTRSTSIRYTFSSTHRTEFRLKSPEWLDTVNVPVQGNVDLMMDFTDPIIRGVSLFHCHLLSHEDIRHDGQDTFQVKIEWTWRDAHRQRAASNMRSDSTERIERTTSPS